MSAVLKNGFDASTWDSSGKLNIFPNFDVLHPTHGEAGDVHSFAIFDQVQALSRSDFLPCSFLPILNCFLFFRH